MPASTGSCLAPVVLDEVGTAAKVWRDEVFGPVVSVRSFEDVDVAIVRSPHANARVLGVDLTHALALPGVVAAVDGEEIRRRTNPIPEGWDTSVIGARRVDWYALAAERARYVGEAVAAVVATDGPTAVAAAELVEVDYQPL